MVLGNAGIGIRKNPAQRVPGRGQELTVERITGFYRRGIKANGCKGRSTEDTASDGEPTVPVTVLLDVGHPIHFDGGGLTQSRRPARTGSALVELIKGRHAKADVAPLNADDLIQLNGRRRKQGIDLIGVERRIHPVVLERHRRNGEGADENAFSIVRDDGVGIEIRGVRIRAARAGHILTEGLIEDQGIRFIVAGTGVATALATEVFAIPFRGNGLGVVVAGQRVSTAENFGHRKDAVAVGVRFGQFRVRVVAIDRLVPIGLPEFRAVDVERRTDQFGLVRISVTVIVNVAVARLPAVAIPVDAIPHDVVGVSGVGNGTVVVAVPGQFRVAFLKATEFDGIGAVAIPIIVHVVRGEVLTIFHRLRAQNRVPYDEVGLVATWENLKVEVAAEHAVRGELSEEHPAILIGNAIALTSEVEPCAPHTVVDDQVASRQAAARIKNGRPRIVGVLNGADRRFTNGSVRRGFNANGHPTVISEVGIHWKEQGIDAIGGRSTEQGLVEVRRRFDARRVVRVTKHRGHEICGVAGLEVQTGRRISRHVHRSQLPHEQTDVFTDHLLHQGVRRGHKVRVIVACARIGARLSLNRSVQCGQQHAQSKQEKASRTGKMQIVNHGERRLGSNKIASSSTSRPMTFVSGDIIRLTVLSNAHFDH